MNRLRKGIVILYCLSMLIVLTYVPWGKKVITQSHTDLTYSHHAFLITDEHKYRDGRYGIDYSMILLEAGAVTALGAILYLLAGKKKP